MPKLTITNWPGAEAPSSAALERLFAEADLSPSWWSNAPLERYNPHSHPYHKVLYCARGNITFIIPNAGDFRLQAGDRLDIPPGTTHAAVVGPDGVTCVEASAP